MEENKNETVIEKEQESQKTFTEEQVLTLIAQDREKTKKELRKELSKEYEKKLSLSKLDDEAREKAEKDDRIAELEEKLAQMTIESNRSELKSTLGSRGLVQYSLQGNRWNRSGWLGCCQINHQRYIPPFYVTII